MSDVAILVPILNRPHRIEPLLASIADATDVPYRVIFAASDQPSIDILDRIGAWYIRDEGGDEGSYPKRINRLFNETNEPYLFCAADDLAFRPGWFQAAMRMMDQFPNSCGVVATNDQHNMAGVHFLVARSYINTLGGYKDALGIVMHPAFRHQYCDDSLRLTARNRGRFALAMDSITEHMHPGAHKAPTDETYQIGEAAGPHDREIFQQFTDLWV